jgi:methyltransferase (TIGR00027 family)
MSSDARISPASYVPRRAIYLAPSHDDGGREGRARPMDATSRRPSLTAVAVDWARRASAAPRAARPVLTVLSGGLVDHIDLRTRAIDDAVTRAVDAGARQLVILGAGLDARAYRLDGLGGVTVFEVDHPRSQAAKVARIGSLAPRAARVVHVPVDFSHQRLGDELAGGGHDAAARTAWICEGVTMYLSPDHLRALMGEVAERSAQGSVLAMTYRSGGEPPFPGPLMGLVAAALRMIGEPLRASPSPDEVAVLLGAAGFGVTSDTSSLAWGPRYGGSARAAWLFRSERLVVAKRRPDVP